MLIFLFVDSKTTARDVRPIVQGQSICTHVTEDMEVRLQKGKEEHDMSRRGREYEPSFEVFRFDKI